MKSARLKGGGFNLSYGNKKNKDKYPIAVGKRSDTPWL